MQQCSAMYNHTTLWVSNGLDVNGHNPFNSDYCTPHLIPPLLHLNVNMSTEISPTLVPKHLVPIPFPHSLPHLTPLPPPSSGVNLKG